MFQLSFAIASVSMISGPMGERAKLPQQIVFAFLHTAFIYPVVAAWIAGGGWLFKLGFHDFAGAGQVYLNGGTCALVGAIILGPRYYRFSRV